MTDAKKKGKYVGIIGAVAVHILAVAFLLIYTFSLPEPQEESGVPVMLGDAPQASGWADPSLVEVETMPDEPTLPQETAEQELITQDVEETVALTPANDSPKQEVRKLEKTEAEKAEEARRLAAAGFQLARDMFSPEANARRLAELFLHADNERQGGRDSSCAV